MIWISLVTGIKHLAMVGDKEMASMFFNHFIQILYAIPNAVL